MCRRVGASAWQPRAAFSVDAGRTEGMEKRPSRAHISSMYYECKCGLIFKIVPREIPLSEPEAAYCENCGLEIKALDAPATRSRSRSIKLSRDGSIDEQALETAGADLSPPLC
jgi:hypothetical protein